MSHGKIQEVRETTPGKAVVRPTFLSSMPQWKQFVFFMLCPALGSLIFFAQGLVPLIIRLSGSHTRVWFLALYLPSGLAVASNHLHASAGFGNSRSDDPSLSDIQEEDEGCW